MEVTKLEWDLMERLRVDARALEISFAIAYFVLQLKKNEISINTDISIKELCSVIQNQQIRGFIYVMLNGFEKSRIEGLFNYSEEALTEYIVTTEDKSYDRGQEYLTPKCINQLAIEILGIEKGDTVVDNCMGIGSFFAEASKVHPDAS